MLDGAYFPNRLRIPDVTVLKDPNGPVSRSNIDKLYEIKFPNDRERPGQMDDYRDIAGSDDKVEKLDVDESNCDGRGDPSAIPLPAEVKQAAIDRANSNILGFIGENEADLWPAMVETGMTQEAQSLQMAYQRGTDPGFFWDVLRVAIPGPKLGGFTLGRLPKPIPSPSRVPSPALP